jgi:hypothetical protein
MLDFFLALSRVFDSAARHSSAHAIAQFGQRATMAVPLNLNFTTTISNGYRQCEQPGSSLRLIDTVQAGYQNQKAWSLFFPIMSFFLFRR